MISTYDADADALYLAFTDADVARTHCIDDGTIVDMDASGAIVGIEVLRPARDWPVDQILAAYEFSPVDRALLEAMYGGGHRRLRTVPLSHDAQAMSQLLEAS
jgi:uncharacterized protein YuzE